MSRARYYRNNRPIRYCDYAQREIAEYENILEGIRITCHSDIAVNILRNACLNSDAPILLPPCHDIHDHPVDVRLNQLLCDYITSFLTTFAEDDVQCPSHMDTKFIQVIEFHHNAKVRYASDGTFRAFVALDVDHCMANHIFHLSQLAGDNLKIQFPPDRIVPRLIIRPGEHVKLIISIQIDKESLDAAYKIRQLAIPIQHYDDNEVLLDLEAVDLLTVNSLPEFESAEFIVESGMITPDIYTCDIQYAESVVQTCDIIQVPVRTEDDASIEQYSDIQSVDVSGQVFSDVNIVTFGIHVHKSSFDLTSVKKSVNVYKHYMYQDSTFYWSQNVLRYVALFLLVHIQGIIAGNILLFYESLLTIIANMTSAVLELDKLYIRELGFICHLGLV